MILPNNIKTVIERIMVERNKLPVELTQAEDDAFHDGVADIIYELEVYSLCRHITLEESMEVVSKLIQSSVEDKLDFWHRFPMLNYMIMVGMMI